MAARLGGRQGDPLVKYLLGLLFPPVGFLSVGKWGQALLSLVLMVTIIGWPIAVIWCWLVISGANADKRTSRLEKAIRESAAASKGDEQAG
jgi:uncharacterized membrane protein YqaE (UPF0057 family)